MAAAFPIIALFSAIEFSLYSSITVIKLTSCHGPWDIREALQVKCNIKAAFGANTGGFPERLPDSSREMGFSN